MLTWNVTYHCKSGQREAFYQALCDLGIRANSLKEEGNLKYDYFLAAEAPDDLLLVESWTTPELQQAHCQTEIFGRLQELKAQYCDSVQIDKFDHGLGADEEFEKHVFDLLWPAVDYFGSLWR